MEGGRLVQGESRENIVLVFILVTLVRRRTCALLSTDLGPVDACQRTGTAIVVGPQSRIAWPPSVGGEDGIIEVLLVEDAARVNEQEGYGIWLGLGVEFGPDVQCRDRLPVILAGCFGVHVHVCAFEDGVSVFKISQSSRTRVSSHGVGAHVVSEWITLLSKREVRGIPVTAHWTEIVAPLPRLVVYPFGKARMHIERDAHHGAVEIWSLVCVDSNAVGICQTSGEFDGRESCARAVSLVNEQTLLSRLDLGGWNVRLPKNQTLIQARCGSGAVTVSCVLTRSRLLITLYQRIRILSG